LSHVDAYTPAESVTIRDQVAVVGRRWRAIVLLIVIGVGLAVGYTHTKAVHYISHAQVQVLPVTTDQFASSPTPAASSVSMPTEQQIASSHLIANAARAKLPGTLTAGQALTHLKVTVPANTEILDFAYSAGTASAAQAGASSFEAAYLANRKSTVASDVAPVRKQLTAQQTTLNKQRTSLEAQLNRTTDPTERSTIGSQLNALGPLINANSASLTELDNINPAGASVVESGTLPAAPAGASHTIILSAGLAAGLILGLIAAFILDAMDDHLHGPKDLAALTGAPVLARVPLLRSAIPWNRHDLAAEGTSHPKVSEAYRLLVNRLVVLASRESLNSILVVSPAKGEGRSSVAANAAATFVDLGYRVWLVSADLRSPQMHRLFSLDESSGLVSVVPMTDAAELAPASVKELTVAVDHNPAQPSQGHLTLMANIERPRAVGRLLNPLVLARQVEQNQDLVDMTIIDAPALLDFADAIPLLPVVDGVLVVADAGTTRRSELVELCDLLDSTGARIIGSVLNRDGASVVSRRARRARRRLASQQPKPRTEGKATTGRAATGRATAGRATPRTASRPEPDSERGTASSPRETKSGSSSARSDVRGRH
jgi:succinoglycan biosynthesis transport protein ExoP